MNSKNLQVIIPVVLLVIIALAVVGFNQDNASGKNNSSDFAAKLNNLYNDIYESCKNSVVSIRSTVTVNELESGEGTGFFINEKGYVLTSFDNVKQADVVTIMYSKKSIEMEIEKLDKNLGLAMLKPIKNLAITNFLQFTESSDPELADVCIALTNSMKSISLTSKPIMFIGEVAGFYSDEDGYKKLVEMNLSYDSSNIGSPILNIDGEVVGLCSKYQKAGRWLTTAIPVSVIRNFVGS